MRLFDEQLLRLKQVLGLVEDQAVASALGMSKAAFADRKKRGSFPEDKLKALAADKPDLRLDVKYVLTGVSDALERRMEAIREATQIALELMPGDSAKGELVRDVLLGTQMRSPEIINAAIERFVESLTRKQA
ncbi:MAG: hypothetical protein DI597_00860 [Pseudoxanthomonas spadix]|nr:MAG: hypothetical protein DI597_00860 [Pseudoxanthomonas spadix]